MMQVLQSSEFWAAVAGGLLSLAGSFFSLRWQAVSAKKERRDLYITFYSDSFSYVFQVIRDLENIWDNKNYTSHHHLNQIDRIINAIDKHIDGFALIDDRSLRDSIRRFFFDLSDDINFLRFWENKKEAAKTQFNDQSDRESPIAQAAHAEFLESNSIITKRISTMKSKAADMQPLIAGK